MVEKESKNGWSPKQVGVLIAILTGVAASLSSIVLSYQQNLSNEKVASQMREQTTLTLGLAAVVGDVNIIKEKVREFQHKTFPEFKDSLTEKLVDSTKERIKKPEHDNDIHKIDERINEIRRGQMVIIKETASLKGRIESYFDYQKNRNYQKTN